ncbi:hypothetical protein IDVR_09230 [Intrasporangium sp. DVR]
MHIATMLLTTKLVKGLCLDVPTRDRRPPATPPATPPELRPELRPEIRHALRATRETAAFLPLVVALCAL